MLSLGLGGHTPGYHDCGKRGQYAWDQIPWKNHHRLQELVSTGLFQGGKKIKNRGCNNLALFSSV
jgi:hypothetical protein